MLHSLYDAEIGTAYGGSRARGAGAADDSWAAEVSRTLTAKMLAEVDERQTEMRLKPMRVGDINLYTMGLDPEEQLTCVGIVGSLTEAIGESLARHGDCALAGLPEGPYVVPVYQAAEP